jgi:uncharacterized protein (TIGR02118 family)
MIKSISILSRQPHLSHDEFLHLWEHEHAPLAKQVPHLLRYVLSPVDSQFNRNDITAHGIEVDGVAELWYESLESMQWASQSPQMKILRSHGAQIIGSITNCLTHEIEIIPLLPTSK